MIADAGLDIPEEDAKEVVMEYFRYLVDTKDKHFGNGRLYPINIRNPKLRELRQTEAALTPNLINTLTRWTCNIWDSRHDRREIFPARPRLGFKKNA